MTDDFGPGDFEPGDLEPIDLEPVDLGPAGDEALYERGPRARRRNAWIWVGAIGAAVVVWAAVASTRPSGHSHPRSTAPATTVPAAAAVSRIAVLGPRLRAELTRFGTARWGAVIDDRLYVLDSARGTQTLVPLPEGHVTIDDQSGPSLLASTYAETLVTTAPIATRTLAVDDVAIRSVTAARWWLLHDDGTLRDDSDAPGTAAAVPVPAGLRVVAAVPQGFVALDTGGGWDIWSGASIKRIPVLGQFLAAGPGTLAFKNGCGYGGCTLELFDLAHQTVVTAQLPEIPQFAAFSRDGTRVALASTEGNVDILDTASATVLAQTVSLDSPSPSAPFTWSPDSRYLVVVQSHDVEIHLAADGSTTAVIPGTDGVEQLIALP